MNIKEQFTSEEQHKITAAIQSLEKNTSSELLFFYAESCDSHNGYTWKVGALGACFAALLLLIQSYTWLLPEGFNIYWMLGYVVAGFFVGYLLSIIFPIIRTYVIPRSILLDKLILKAKSIFLDFEVFKLQERNGIVIYVSILEHEVVVLGDEGIHEKIGNEAWTTVVERVIEGKKRKELSTGIIEAIQYCEKLLLDNGFKNTGNSQNVLPDTPTFVKN